MFKWFKNTVVYSKSALMFSCPWFAESSEGAGPWHFFTGRINQTPATAQCAHTFNTTPCSVELTWLDNEHIFCFVFKLANTDWRYCHEKSKTHLGVCCMYLLNCPDNILEVSWRIARAQTATFTSVFRTHWHAPKVGIQKARAIQALMSLWKGFGRISEFKARAVLTETVRNVTTTSHLIFKTPGYTELQTVCATRPANQVNIRYSHN